MFLFLSLNNFWRYYEIPRSLINHFEKLLYRLLIFIWIIYEISRIMLEIIFFCLLHIFEKKKPLFLGKLYIYTLLLWFSNELLMKIRYDTFINLLF